ncbi:MAG: DUF1501 domain-containing protein [Polyangiaceae bacterium]
MSANSLVVLFLRGGADGLALAPSLDHGRMRELRPTLAEEPLEAGLSVGLHHALAPLVPLIQNHELDLVVGVGSDDDTRSHFEAQARMESAGPTRQVDASGWIARHLASRPGPAPGPLAALSIGAMVPASLRGASATALESVEELVRGAPDDAMLDALGELYEGLEDARPLANAGKDAVHVARALRALALADHPRTSLYPEGALGRRLAEVAMLLQHRNELGVEVVALDQDGWDTHFVEATLLAENAAALAHGVVALRDDLGPSWADTTVVILTEFGRRAYENVSKGTDHGRASVAIVAGGALPKAGARGDWGALDDSALEGPGDLPVTLDYRVWLADLVRGALGNPHIDAVFPGLRLRARTSSG